MGFTCVLITWAKRELVSRVSKCNIGLKKKWMVKRGEREKKKDE